MLLMFHWHWHLSTLNWWATHSYPFIMPCKLNVFYLSLLKMLSQHSALNKVLCITGGGNNQFFAALRCRHRRFGILFLILIDNVILMERKRRNSEVRKCSGSWIVMESWVEISTPTMYVSVVHSVFGIHAFRQNRYVRYYWHDSNFIAISLMIKFSKLS